MNITKFRLSDKLLALVRMDRGGGGGHRGRGMDGGGGPRGRGMGRGGGGFRGRGMNRGGGDSGSGQRGRGNTNWAMPRSELKILMFGCSAVLYGMFCLTLSWNSLKIRGIPTEVYGTV